ncbi:MAG TPA: aminomethyl-transferring glycine dehydrogenase subunit GcvPA [Candidatus Omnitrophota bacterium]|nr:aminomethyl-transferring glycine dehydrogenase subunit GcvPA [Candidatus Omnitrophota bacterium]HRY86135.1 aminomethyl-transferring glycine dehydrogenase subunit GcvPA [Candidatus Omnitrophota bacterium]
MPYLSLTAEEKKAMFDRIGVRSFDELTGDIPASLRDPKISLPAGLSELEIQDLVAKLGQKNTTVKGALSFLGAGSYDHFIPAAVFDIVGRQEFSTAYTPYQPEASQGTLQAIYEYQSLMVELTGLDVSNASHYDGATSLAEAALVALKQTDRSKLLIARSVHPHYRQTIRTYLAGTPYQIEEINFDAVGNFKREELLSRLDATVAGVIFQTPNFLGVMENLEGVSEKIHANGSLMILTANPLSLGLFKSPGEWGADIAAGEGQPLGLSMNFGGPYLGYFVTSQALMRRIPGRLAGLTEDADGKRAFCLTLQAREQHIRRERAGSNICSNQALCALAACVYMTLLGKKGIREIAEINWDRANYLRSKISSLKNYEVDPSQTIFNEFRVRSNKPFPKIQEKLMAQGIFPGVALEPFYPELKDHFLVCATETKSKEDLDRFVEALERC